MQAVHTFWQDSNKGGAVPPMKKGQEAFGKRDFATAELAFRQATLEQPGSAHAWKLLGLVYSAQEQYQKAEEPLSRACSLDPHEENACYYLGRLYYTLGRFGESQQAFETRMVKIFMRRGCSTGVGRQGVLDSGFQVADRAQAEQGQGRAERCSCLGGCVLGDNALGTG
jgi:hypothetical protein